MRIAVFSTTDILPPHGGAEVALGEIMKRLPDVEFDLYCAKYFSNHSRVERVGSVTIHRYGFGWGILDKILFVSLAPFAVVKAHKRKPYDFAWSMMASWGGLVAVSTKLLVGLPYLLSLQEGDSFADIDRRTRFVRPWFLQIFREAKAVQAISTFLDKWGRRMGFAGSISRVIPNGVDTETFSREIPQQRIAEVRASFGFPADAFILVTTSRLVKKNAVQDVIDALVQLPPNVCFVVCGFGELESILKDRVRELHLESRMKFLGSVSHEHLPEIIRASDAFIRPSLSEGLGNSFLEAMAVGVPVIGTMVGGITDFLVDGQTGFVCRPSNPESIARTVEKVMKLDRVSQELVCVRAKAMVYDRFTWDVVAKQMRLLFEEILGTR